MGRAESITLAAPTTLGLMFVDADSAFNSGQGTVTLDSGGTTATVDAVANVLRWNEGCITTPAMLVVNAAPHRVTLTASTLSS